MVLNHSGFTGAGEASQGGRGLDLGPEIRLDDQRGRGGGVQTVDRMEEGGTGAQGSGGTEKIHQEEACVYPRKGCGDGSCRSMDFCCSPCRPQMCNPKMKAWRWC